jgi:hypothetical protein
MYHSLPIYGEDINTNNVKLVLKNYKNFFNDANYNINDEDLYATYLYYLGKDIYNNSVSLKNN